MANHMYLEEMDGQRSVIVTDGNYGWWNEPCEDGAFCGLNLYDGTMEKVAADIRTAITAFHGGIAAAIEAFKTEDRRNPAVTITKKQYEDYQRLKEIERSGHVLTTDGLRFIIAANDGDPDKIGKYFLELSGEWNVK